MNNQTQKLEISNLVNAENNIAIHQVLVIAKQDVALQNAINALNELAHINRLEFEAHGKPFGITELILEEVRNLQAKLEKAKYGRY